MLINKMRNGIVFIVFMLILSGVAVASPDRDKDKPGKQLRKELKGYLQANVLPVLKDQRTKLETQLSEQDRRQVAELRAKLHALGTQKRNLKKQAKASGGELSEADKQQLEQLKTQAKGIMETAKTIASRYETNISSLRQEIAPQHKQWETDLKAIVEEHKAALPVPQEQEHGKHGKHGKHHKHAMIMRRLIEMKPVAFLLWDHTREPGQHRHNDRTDVPSVSPAQEISAPAVVYPNPTEVDNKVDFSVKKAGDVTITLIDEQGNVVKTVLDEYKEKGQHTTTVSTSGLKSGVYYYKITTKSGTETKRFVIK